MAYEIIKVDEFPRFTNGEAIVSFSKNGGIRFSKAATERLGLISKGSWIAFMVDKESLGLKVYEVEKPNTVKALAKKSSKGMEYYYMQSKPLVQHLKQRLDWAIAEGKLTAIKYKVPDAPNSDKIFELF
jgi:hypothetical protein